jgi:hypothetical protein
MNISRKHRDINIVRIEIADSPPPESKCVASLLKFVIKNCIGDDISLKISNIKITSMTFAI